MEILVIWFICGVAAALIAGGKGRSGSAWFVGGLLFGVFALLAALVVSGYQCPYCFRGIHPQATRCPYCQADLTPEMRLDTMARIEHAGREANRQGGGRAALGITALVVVLGVGAYWVGDALSSAPAGSYGPRVNISATVDAQRATRTTRDSLSYVTIDGVDTDGTIISPVNLWDNYQTRSRIIAQVNHGGRVMLVRREGNAVLVRISSGRQGWLSAQFIKEYK